MLSYRHIYHAGNFADVVKHVTLNALLEALQRKDTAYYVQDTHAGSGRYDLDSGEAGKHREYDTGIARVLEASGAPAIVTQYVQRVQTLNPQGGLRWYPGSPLFTQGMLREQDRLLLTELHPQDHAALYALLHHDKRIAIHKQDAYQGLRAFLPPKQKRGLVLIDPAYERKDEYTRAVAGLQLARQRWANGCLALWYPLLSRRLQQTLLQDVAASGLRKILLAELMIEPLRTEKRFVGCGVLIVNPPWQLEDVVAECFAWLQPILRITVGGNWRVQWLVPE